MSLKRPSQFRTATPNGVLRDDFGAGIAFLPQFCTRVDSPGFEKSVKLVSETVGRHFVAVRLLHFLTVTNLAASNLAIRPKGGCNGDIYEKHD